MYDSISIFFMGAFQSNLKFLFLFIIIISTIEIHETYGILIAFISSFIILSADLIYGPNVSVNQYLITFNTFFGYLGFSVL
jgi:hypothetical protein